MINKTLVSKFKNWVIFFFQDILEEEVDHRVKNKLKEEREKLEFQKVTLNYPIGTEIIVRTNEPGPLIHGKVIGHRVNAEKGSWIEYQDLETGNGMFSFYSDFTYYHPEIWRILSTLTWNEQWNILSRGRSIILYEDKKRKELYTKEFLTEVQKLSKDIS